MPSPTREQTDSPTIEAIDARIRSQVKREVRRINTSIAADDLVSVTVTFDGHNAVIVAGSECSIVVDKGFTLTNWYLISDQTGDIQIDVYVDDFASFPPTVADTITGGNEPSLTAANSRTDSTLTGWSTNIADGDVIKFHVDSATSIVRATLILNGTRT